MATLESPSHAGGLADIFDGLADLSDHHVTWLSESQFGSRSSRTCVTASTADVPYLVYSSP